MLVVYFAHSPSLRISPMVHTKVPGGKKQQRILLRDLSFNHIPDIHHVCFGFHCEVAKVGLQKEVHSL